MLYLGGATHLTIQSKDFARSGALQRRDKAAHVVVVQDIRHMHLPNLNRRQNMKRGNIRKFALIPKAEIQGHPKYTVQGPIFYLALRYNCNVLNFKYVGPHKSSKQMNIVVQLPCLRHLPLLRGQPRKV
jgi:hypothetical protein